VNARDGGIRAIVAIIEIPRESRVCSITHTLTIKVREWLQRGSQNAEGSGAERMTKNAIDVNLIQFLCSFIDKNSTHRVRWTVVFQ